MSDTYVNKERLGFFASIFKGLLAGKANKTEVSASLNGKLDKPTSAGTNGQVLTSNGNGGQSWETPASPPVSSVNNKTGAVTLTASDVGAGTYSKPSGGIPASDLASGVIPDVSGFYTKPSGGIPGTDLASGVVPTLTDLIDDTAGNGDTNKVWSADKVYDEVSDLNSHLSILEPAATSGDVGKFLKAKTVADGKVTEYEFGEGGSIVTTDKTLTQENVPADAKAVGNAISNLSPGVGVKARYGVRGIGRSTVALTRIMDSVGMVAQVGTDGDNSAICNDFDTAIPFMRKKCVGTWNLVNNKAVFTVNKYLGDDGYTEDGTAGDYVAVECPLCYYYFDAENGVLAVSAYKYQGWKPFDVFCVGHDPNNTLDKIYLPAYALAKNAQGYAVSLPGYDNEQGSYKALVDVARTYKNGALGNAVILQPAAVNFYEWALFTVEFATQNCQSIMAGCSSLRHNANDRVIFTDSTHAIAQNWQAARVAGQYVCITKGDIADTNASYYATHRVVSVTRCDQNGTANSSGTYALLELQDLGKAYYTYDTTTAYKLSARPYRTGACNGVSTPSGSPVHNTNGYYPMKYRWRENVYGNQYKTSMDLFNTRKGTGDSDYYLDWYYLLTPESYEPSSTSKPDATELSATPFVKLGVQTLHDNYVNGYIKSKKYDENYPDIWIPYETTGATSTTFFSDYASLVFSYAVRSVRFGGYWSSGAYAGFSSVPAYYAPSSSSASYGGDLCIAQSGG